MNWGRKTSGNIASLKKLADEGDALREMFGHPAFAIIEKRLEAEQQWVDAEWNSLLEMLPETDLYGRQRELYAYKKALELMKFIFLDQPKIGWKAADKVLAYAERAKKYARQ